MKVDSQINFDWGTREIIPNVASSFVSIIWEGFLNANTTGNYIFTIIANDGVKLTIN